MAKEIKAVIKILVQAGRANPAVRVRFNASKLAMPSWANTDRTPSGKPENAKRQKRSGLTSPD